MPHSARPDPRTPGRRPVNAGEREGLRRLLERLDLDHAQFAGRGSLFGDAADAIRALLDALEAAERKIAAVEALADEWEDVEIVDADVTYGSAAEQIRAALATAESGRETRENGPRSADQHASGQRDHHEGERLSGAGDGSGA